MYYFQFSYDYIKAKHEELLKEAETERMIRKYHVKSPKESNFFRIILKHLGETMIKWGLFLKNKYEGSPCNQRTQCYS